MVVREGVEVALIGKTSSLPPDISPIQIGTQGRFGNTAFTVLGRVRLKWRLGAWTEWFVEFGDNTTGWMAEAQGFFMVSRAETPENLPRQNDLQRSAGFNWRGVPMTMADVKEVVVDGCEGELPYAAPPGRESLSVDLTGPNSAFACIEYSGAEVRTFFGRYCTFEELEFSNLRPVPGWFGNPPLAHETGVNAVNCPRCGSVSELKAPGSTVTLVCGSCGSVLDVASGDAQIITEAAKKLNIQPFIPLGTRGTLFGVEYEAIGFLQRADGPYTWFEYLLFNPHVGYTWLVNYKGHWNFVERLLNFPDEVGNIAVLEGRPYRLFLRGTATVRYVVGEFYWRVNFDEKAQTADYVRPPYILSKEDYPELQEVTWSRGQYVEGEQIQLAFKIPKASPEPVGVYMNQPNPYVTKGGFLGATTTALLALLILIQIVSVGRARNQLVAEQNFTFDSGDTNQTTAVIEFEVKGKPQAVKVTSFAGLQNSWLDLGYELLNVKTGERRDFLEGLEYYYGPDWSEGSQRKSTVIPAVEPGKYQLIIDPDCDPKTPIVRYDVAVKTDVPVWRNFIFCLLLLLAYPTYRFGRSAAFEQKRQAESDYDSHGFTTELEDDDE